MTLAFLFQIPKEIGQLRYLTCLDISHNRDIKHLPEEMGDLDHLFVVRESSMKCRDRFCCKLPIVNSTMNTTVELMILHNLSALEGQLVPIT